MALTIGQKCGRILRFLRGIRHVRTATALAAYGFTRDDLEEGWQLLRNASDNRMALVPPARASATSYDQLDEWENKWFPIAGAALERHFPDVHAKVFLNLRQTSGTEVVVSVGTLVQRIRQLEQSKDKSDLGARQLLSKRGLNAAALSQAESMLAGLEDLPEPPPVVVPNSETVSAAEDAMWAWYREWSRIARHAIHDRNLLRSLGFLTRRGAEVPEDEPTEEDVIDDDNDIAAVA